MIEILETCETELGDVQRLWADGDVMRYVGFPEGLRQSNEEMGRWYEWIRRSRPRANHYSVFEDGVYCGETFYRIDEKRGNSAAVDIELFAFARGRSRLRWRICGRRRGKGLFIWKDFRRGWCW